MLALGSCAGALQKESGEQRKAKLEMEALAAAEEEHARAAAAAVAMRQCAAREAQHSAVNSRQLNAEWLQRMRAAKLGELQQEAGELSRRHDADIDRRDRLIEVGAGGTNAGDHADMWQLGRGALEHTTSHVFEQLQSCVHGADPGAGEGHTTLRRALLFCFFYLCSMLRTLRARLVPGRLSPAAMRACLPQTHCVFLGA